MRYWIVFLALFAVGSASTVFAAADITAFKLVFQLATLDITEPRVVELTFPIEAKDNSFLVVENQSAEAQPFQTRNQVASETPYTITTSVGDGSSLVDKSTSTFLDFPLESEGFNDSTVTLNFANETSLSGVNLNFSDYSRSPSYIKIESVKSDGPNIVVLGQTSYTSPTIRFPIQKVDNLIITLVHSQPLRLTGITVIEDPAAPVSGTQLRFLAKPGQSYSIYFHPDRSLSTAPPRAGNYFNELNPLRPSSSVTLKPNPNYIPSDKDSDAIPDTADNCPLIANTDQADTNGNGAGDVCDDTDFDGIINLKDNCPDDPNPDQRDVDGDLEGDICDGEESRFTEKNPWLPWVAMGGTVLVIVALVLQMSKSKALAESSVDAQSPPDEQATEQ